MGGDEKFIRSWSLSARRAWIEIILDYFSAVMRQVALRKESVDRNCCAASTCCWRAVALRKESVDRNVGVGHGVYGLEVALRKESVDRNTLTVRNCSGPDLSLSARRAWIEMMDDFEPSTTRRVALRKESVDRNKTLVILLKELDRSLSARRAWIEISSVLPRIG